MVVAFMCVQLVTAPTTSRDEAQEGSSAPDRDGTRRRNTMPAKVVFHIGLEKTGITSFQKFCHGNSALLRAHGLLYPVHSFAFARRTLNHAPLVASYIASDRWGDYDLAGSPRSRAKVVASLKAEIEGAHGIDTALISAEHFSSRFFPAHIEALADDFEAFDCKIVVVVRAHETRARSAYSTTIRSGRGLTIDEFFDELLLPGNWYVRYRETIERWREVFGRSNVKLVRYEEQKDIVDQLAGVILAETAGTHGEGRLSGRRHFVNSDIDATVLEAQRRVNMEITSRQCGLLGPVRHRLISLARAGLLRALTRRLSGRTPSMISVDPLRRQSLEQMAAVDRAFLFEEYGLRLAEPNDGLAGSDSTCEAIRTGAEALLSNPGWRGRVWRAMLLALTAF